VKKISILIIALVVALGSLGIGYAAWLDTITITGDVQTGSLDLVVVRTSGDNVYKDLDTDALVYQHWIDYLPPDETPTDYSVATPTNALLVAWTTSELVGDDEVEMSWNNLFPFDGGPWGGFVGDIRVYYQGTIPAKIHVDLDETNLGCVNPAWISYTWFVYESEGGALLYSGSSLAGLEGIQIHDDYVISLGIIITIPQEDSAMNCTAEGAISFTLTAIQWNEFDTYYP